MPRREASPREKLHQFIDRVADEAAKPALHAAVDALDEALIPDALARMRVLRVRTRQAAYRRARRARPPQSKTP